MPTYTPEELEKFRETEPAKYFYYSHEEYFRDQLGINLDNPNWEAVVFSLGKRQKLAPDEDKYLFFQFALNDGGIEFLDRKGNVMVLSTGKATLRNDLDALPVEAENGEFKLRKYADHEPTKREMPKIEDTYETYRYNPGLKKPASLGFGHWFMWYVTFGHWNVEQHNTYVEQLNAYNGNERARVRAEDDFNNIVMAPINRNRELRKDFFGGLEVLGHGADQRENYAKFERERIAAEEAANKIITAVNNSKERCVRVLNDRAYAVDRLNYLMGPQHDDAKSKEVHDKIIGSGFMKEKNLTATFSVKLPEHTGLNDHEIALLGYAAMSSDGVIRNSILQPDTTKPVPEGEMTRHQKMAGEQNWYMQTESYFTVRQRAETSYCDQWLVYARQALADALTDFRDNDDATKLGVFVKEAIVRTTKAALYQDEVNDNFGLPDYCNMVHEMMDLCANKPLIKAAAEKAGLTQDMIDEAGNVYYMADVWKNGYEAQKALADPNTAATRESVADLMAMRLLQTTLTGLVADINNGEEYTNAYMELEKAQNEATRQYKKSGTKEDLQKLGDAGQDALAFSVAGAMDVMGVKIESNANIKAMFTGPDCVKNLRQDILESGEVDKLMALPKDKIIEKLLPGSTNECIRNVTAKINEKHAPQQQNVIIEQPELNNNISRNNSIASSNSAVSL